MASKFLAGITQPHGASATSFLKPIAALVSYLSPSKYRKENTSDTPGVYQGEGPGRHGPWRSNIFGPVSSYGSASRFSD